ncbi:hypothetical protein JD844_012137 [Phrynosoma platyrhinos]|uniref:Uncharacterized protein n=1 Tax=Phrynosoma platyrhinos TaxID=52577 RepID=A0ABQ7TJG8_PHRPL|nr:hypothetical protein JD844_012137 [Phrynosoma platyrhinos]
MLLVQILLLLRNAELALASTNKWTGAAHAGVYQNPLLARLITLFTVLRRKKKCIRYLQGEGRCASPVSSDGSAIDSPPSPLDVLQCIPSAFTPDKLAAPADLTPQNLANPFPISAPIKTATSTSRLTSKCSAVPHIPAAPSESSGYSVLSIGT